MIILFSQHPLPACASGEWGPAKAIRHFNIHPLTHFQSIFETHSLPLIIKFQCPKVLKFHGRLNSNQTMPTNGTSNSLDKYVKYEYNESDLTITFIIQLPNEGQYGLDIYARDPEYQTERRTMSHCCKYIINYSQTTTETTTNTQLYSFDQTTARPLPNSTPSSLPKIGANKNLLSQLGMTPINHPDPSITLHSINTVELQFQLRKMVDFSFDLLYQHSSADLSSSTRLNASEYVTIKSNGGCNVIFALNLPQTGVYTFIIYAATTANNDRNETQIGMNGQTDLPAVFTYLIRYV